jgi:hypothetical protein
LIGGGAEIYVGSPATAARPRKATDPPSGATTTSEQSCISAWAKKHGITRSRVPTKTSFGARALRLPLPLGSGTGLIVRFLSKQAGPLRPGSDDTAWHG